MEPEKEGMARQNRLGVHRVKRISASWRKKETKRRAVRVTALFVFRQLADGFQTVGHPMSNSLTSLDKYFIMRLDTNGFLS